ncbi:DUF599 domain-containing protein [Prosthecomicrobium sp. N25]|uniref:DUF599 domain-containing protein n=1 Tax=Prosthecomicrobium sp. N25 TaxID=3129254 RepID=UPI003076C9B7
MFDLGHLDLIALLWFSAAWLGFGWLTDSSPYGRSSLTRAMEEHRRAWMREMLKREVRIIDTQIMGSLQNGTAFFASTSLIAIGAAFTLLSQADRLVEVFRDLPIHVGPRREEIELKVLILAAIYGYAFFKFGWAYRLFNYSAILIGAVPLPPFADQAAAEKAAARAADMQIIAARHFNWGLRAFFFSIAFLGWFVNAWVLIGTTTFILLVLLRRQYLSRAKAAAEG